MKWTWSVCAPGMSYCSFARALTGVLKQDFSTDSGVVGAFSEDAPPLPLPPPMTNTEPRDEEASTVVATAEASRSCRVTGRFTALTRVYASLQTCCLQWFHLTLSLTRIRYAKFMHTHVHARTDMHTRHTTHHPHTHTHSCKPDRYSSRQ